MGINFDFPDAEYSNWDFHNDLEGCLALHNPV